MRPFTRRLCAGGHSASHTLDRAIAQFEPSRAGLLGAAGAVTARHARAREACFGLGERRYERRLSGINRNLQCLGTDLFH
jgi:hypothetical protein